MAKFPEVFRFRVPVGFQQTVTEAAACEGLVASAYVRKVALRELTRARTKTSAMTMHDGPAGLIAA